jgi:hypothetical protein
VAFDSMPSGGDPHGPWCTSCRAPITAEQRSVRIDFRTDPDGNRGLSGLYHEQCSRPFQSFARIINLDWFGRF